MADAPAAVGVGAERVDAGDNQGIAQGRGVKLRPADAGRAPRGAAASRPQQARPRGAADRWARRLLRVREPEGDNDVYNLFSSSMVLSGIRCLLSYIVFPVLAPWLGTVPLVGPIIGIPIGVVALVFDVRAIRRFFQADHRWRWLAAAVYFVVMLMVAYLLVRDVLQLA